jgi:hypothetical protein
MLLLLLLLLLLLTLLLLLLLMSEVQRLLEHKQTLKYLNTL